MNDTMTAEVTLVLNQDPVVAVTITMRRSQLNAMVKDLGAKAPNQIQQSNVQWVAQLYHALSEVAK
jgi:hypothetical protein